MATAAPHRQLAAGLDPRRRHTVEIVPDGAGSILPLSRSNPCPAG
jgi:hypothetical protein